MTPKNSKTGISKPIRLCKYEVANSNKSDTDKNLLVKNLDPRIKAKEFIKMFDVFGEISSCKLEVDNYGQSKSYGYVNYENSQSADLAIDNMVKISK